MRWVRHINCYVCDTFVIIITLCTWPLFEKKNAIAAFLSDPSAIKSLKSIMAHKTVHSFQSPTEKNLYSKKKSL